MNVNKSDCHVVDRHMVQRRTRSWVCRVRSLIMCCQPVGLWAGTMDCHGTRTSMLTWMWRKWQYWDMGMSHWMLPASCLHLSTNLRLGSLGGPSPLCIQLQVIIIIIIIIISRTQLEHFLLFITRDLQKVSALIFLKLYLLKTSKSNYVTFLYSHPAFRCIFPSILPTF